MLSEAAIQVKPDLTKDVFLDIFSRTIKIPLGSRVWGGFTEDSDCDYAVSKAEWSYLLSSITKKYNVVGIEEVKVSDEEYGYHKLHNLINAYFWDINILVYEDYEMVCIKKAVKMMNEFADRAEYKILFEESKEHRTFVFERLVDLAFT